MSTASVEAPNKPKNGTSSRRAQLSIQSSQESTEEAVTQLVHSGVSTLRSLLPNAVIHPTQTVALFFDVAEQILTAMRRLALEVAQAAEAGVEGVERYEHRTA